MYKWPQGRVIRTICLVLTLVMTADLGINGVYAHLVPYFQAHSETGGSLRTLLLGIFFGVATLAVLVSGVVGAGFHHRAVDFLIETEQEMARVTWPSLNELVRSTLIIAVIIVVLAAGILAVDVLNDHFINGVLFKQRG